MVNSYATLAAKCSSKAILDTILHFSRYGCFGNYKQEIKCYDYNMIMQKDVVTQLIK